MFMNNETFSN